MYVFCIMFSVGTGGIYNLAHLNIHLGVLEFGGQALNKEGSRREGTTAREKLKIKRQKKKWTSKEREQV